MNKKTNIGVLLGLLAVLGALLLLVPVDRHLVDFIGWVQQAGAWGGVVFGLAYVVGVVVFIPGTLLTLAAGFVFGLFWGTIIVSVASTIGATISLLIGRFLVYDWVTEKVADRPRFQALYRAIDNEGFKTIVLARLVPVFPFALVNYGFSTTRIPISTYVVGTFLGSLPATIVYVYLGSFASSLARLLSGDVEESQLQDTLFIVGGIASVLITVVITRQARKELAKITDAARDADDSNRGVLDPTRD